MTKLHAFVLATLASFAPLPTASAETVLHRVHVPAFMPDDKDLTVPAS